MDVSVLEWIAVVTIAFIALKLVWNVLHFIFTTFLGAWLGFNLDLRKYGPWAVVTGATDGIGKAYAHKLASIGLNVVIISRSTSKLQATAKELQGFYPFVQIKTLAIDFTGNHSIYKVIASKLADLRVGILINNVGMNLYSCQPFADLQHAKINDDMIHCNIMSMTRMTHMFLPGMIRQNHGVIINVGSISGAFSTPLTTVYAATKAFVDRFSRDLTTEVRGTGVVVQTVLPGFVLTNLLNELTGSSYTESWLTPSPKDFVEANFRTLGLESRTACFWYHKLLLYVSETTYFLFPDVFSAINYKYVQSLRPTAGLQKS